MWYCITSFALGVLLYYGVCFRYIFISILLKKLATHFSFGSLAIGIHTYNYFCNNIQVCVFLIVWVSPHTCLSIRIRENCQDELRYIWTLEKTLNSTILEWIPSTCHLDPLDSLINNSNLDTDQCLDTHLLSMPILTSKEISTAL